MRSRPVLPEDRVPIVGPRAAGDGDRHAAPVTIRLCNLLKQFHNHYYANHICGTEGSDIDDARGPAPGLQEHDSAGALASKEAAVVSSIVMPSPLWFRIGRAGRRSSHP